MTSTPTFPWKSPATWTLRHNDTVEYTRSGYAPDSARFRSYIPPKSCSLPKETIPYTLNGGTLPDYNRIVESAAKKLESDFKGVLATLAKTYSEGS